MGIDWFSGWEFWLSFVGGYLLMALFTLALCSHLAGQIVPTTASEDSLHLTSDERERKTFFEGCAQFCLLWPFQILAATGFFLINGLIWVFEFFSDGVKDRAEQAALRARVPKLEKEFDLLWDKRNALPFGTDLDYYENKKLRLLERELGITRPDTRKPQPLGKMMEASLEKNRNFKRVEGGF